MFEDLKELWILIRVKVLIINTPPPLSVRRNAWCTRALVLYSDTCC